MLTVFSITQNNQFEKKFCPAYWPTRADHHSTVMRVLAEIIASDVSLLVTFNHAIDGVLKGDSKSESTSQLDETRARWWDLFNETSPVLIQLYESLASPDRV